MKPHHVPLVVVDVFDDEDHVESGQDGGHEVDVVFALRVVPASEHRVSGSEDGAAGVQSGGDTGLWGRGGGLRGFSSVHEGRWDFNPPRKCPENVLEIINSQFSHIIFPRFVLNLFSNRAVFTKTNFPQG